MKRSDAILRIFETLETAFSHPEGNSKLAVALMKTIEEMGMQPPNVTLNELVPGDWLCNESHYYACWEPEE